MWVFVSIFRRRIWQDRLYTFRNFYKRKRFALIDLAFGLIALLINPYRSSRKFLEKEGAEEIYAYGETPYRTYERIAKECQIGPEDTWIELGSGRGKGCFWLSEFTGCRVIGIEKMGKFVFFARLIQRFFRVSNVTFEKNDFERADLKRGTILYSYGLYPKENIPEGVRILTTGEPLEGYTILKRFWIRFPWGRTTAFLQQKKR